MSHLYAVSLVYTPLSSGLQCLLATMGTTGAVIALTGCLVAGCAWSEIGGMLRGRGAPPCGDMSCVMGVSGLITAIGGVIAGAGLGGGMTGVTVCVAGAGTAARVVGGDVAIVDDGSVVGCAGTGGVEAVGLEAAAGFATAGVTDEAAVGTAPETSKGSCLPGTMILTPESFRSTMTAKTAATNSTAKTKVPN